MRRLSEYSPRRKAAIILTVLGPDAAAQVVKHFDEETVEELSLEVARLDRVTPETRDAIITEFHDMAIAQNYISEGGLDQARSVLEKAFGSDRADAMVEKIMGAMQVVPFDFLKRADPQQLLSFIQDEHPQTVALILAYMPTSQASVVLGRLNPELRAEVAERIATMDQSAPEVIERVEAVLEKKVSSVLSQEMTKAGGPKALVDLLNRVDRSTERMIIDGLSDTNPELAETVKNMMFVFEDIVQLEDRDVMAVLKEVDLKDLATALKGVGEPVHEKIYRNMSERASGMLKEEIDYMGPLKMRVVEESQQKIVAVIRRLEEAGEVSIARGEEQMVV